MGHEFLGTIEECGPGLHDIRPGDRVLAPFSTSCGECSFCERGLTARCELGQLFGWIEEGRGLHGGQAAYVRVPLADTSLVKMPDAIDPEAALFAGDILATGLFAADMGGVSPGASVAVLGCGPAGLMAVAACRHRGADRVLAVDPVLERRRLAERFGAESFDSDRETVEKILEATQGVDVVLEMAGSPEATRLAVDLLRPGGTLAAAGVHTETEFAFSPAEAYDKNLTYRAGRCSVRSYMDEALELAAKEAADLTRIITDREPLAEAAAAYRRFDRREHGCVKVLLIPGAPAR